MDGDANQAAVDRVLATIPRLVGVKPAGAVILGFAPGLIPHAPPPGPLGEMADVLRGGLVGAALLEGLASDSHEAEHRVANREIALGAAQQEDMFSLLTTDPGYHAMTCDR